MLFCFSSEPRTELGTQSVSQLVRQSRLCRLDLAAMAAAAKAYIVRTHTYVALLLLSRVVSLYVVRVHAHDGQVETS